MVSVFLSRQGDDDEVIAELWEAGTTGIVEHEDPATGGQLEAFFDSEEEAGEVASRFPERQPRVHLYAQRDYVSEFQQAWPPLDIGRRWWLAPPWHAGPPPAGRIRLDYRPGMACGSGAHPCTQLCLELLEDLVPPGGAFADIGAGSGILLEAARLLGAERIAGCDIEHSDAVTAAAGGDVFTGSARSLRSCCFDVAVANISAPAAHQLLSELVRIVRPGGWIVLSGFRASEVDQAWAPTKRLERDGWVALALARG